MEKRTETNRILMTAVCAVLAVAVLSAYALWPANAFAAKKGSSTKKEKKFEVLYDGFEKEKGIKVSKDGKTITAHGIKYNMNGGKAVFEKEDGEEGYSFYHSKGEMYYFDHWNTKANGKGKNVSDEAKFTEREGKKLGTLYAIWLIDEAYEDNCDEDSGDEEEDPDEDEDFDEEEYINEEDFDEAEADSDVEEEAEEESIDKEEKEADTEKSNDGNEAIPTEGVTKAVVEEDAAKQEGNNAVNATEPVSNPGQKTSEDISMTVTENSKETDNTAIGSKTSVGDETEHFSAENNEEDKTEEEIGADDTVTEEDDSFINNDYSKGTNTEETYSTSASGTVQTGDQSTAATAALIMAIAVAIMGVAGCGKKMLSLCGKGGEKS